VLDSLWKDHLLNMDHLKEGIGLRGYGQHDPLVEYKRESFDMFEEMMKKFQEETVRYLYLMQVLERPPEGGVAGGPQGQAPDAGVPVLRPGGGNGRPPRQIATSVDELEEAFQRKKRRELEQARMAGGGEQKTVQQVVRGAEKVGRNGRPRPSRSAVDKIPRCARNDKFKE
jgi:preprotein translocase subunit SecA